ncbi:MAG: hypothetical protein A2428_11175 [Bdellovibrionales bacterium RIFOXYC1_FULL_54_43]|nr:MAG: hypothetical protein A2428_11175 [Bdellovibrionales bacterium RIFOXYC1_FULL_54_43]OFZ83526.1 MAG: hypothetical protein A2603_15380 [Bdellovibrionales bacterium RIFOXYD1_FULL_55_31]
MNRIRIVLLGSFLALPLHAYAADVCTEVNQDGYAGRLCGEQIDREERELNKRSFSSHYGGTLTGNTPETQGKALSKNKMMDVTLQLCPKPDGAVAGQFSYSINSSDGISSFSMVVEGSVTGQTDDRAEMPNYNVEFTARYIVNVGNDPAQTTNLSLQATASVSTRGDFVKKIGSLQSTTTGTGPDGAVESLAKNAVIAWQKADEMLLRAYDRWTSGYCIGLEINPEAIAFDQNLISHFSAKVVDRLNGSSAEAALSAEVSKGSTITPEFAKYARFTSVDYELKGGSASDEVTCSIEAASHQGRDILTRTVSLGYLLWISSDFHIDGKSSQADGRVVAEIPLEGAGAPGSSLRLKGQGAITYESFRFNADTNGQCTVSTATIASTAFVMSLILASGPEHDGLSISELQFMPGNPSETLTIVCNGYAQATATQFWATVFMNFHIQEMTSPNGGPLIIEGWEAVGSGNVLARKSYENRDTKNETTFTEKTVFEVRRRPL